jgi:hypothetical protein
MGSFHFTAADQARNLMHAALTGATHVRPPGAPVPKALLPEARHYPREGESDQ